MIINISVTNDGWMSGKMSFRFCKPTQRPEQNEALIAVREKKLP